MTSKAQSTRRDLFVCLILVVLVVSVYGQVSRFGLVDLDDDSYVTHNPYVLLGFRPDTVRWAFTAVYEGNWMPMVWLSYMADTGIARGLAAHGISLGPGGFGVFHLSNVAQHLLSSILLFFIFLRMTGSRWRSALVATIFAIHPLHVESVAWVAERKDTLSALFWMLTMLAYLNYVRRPGLGRYVLVAVSLALGLMAKSMLVTLPAILLLMDFWPLGRLASARNVWPLLREKLPLFALSAGSALMAFHAQGSAAYIAPDAVFPTSVRLANAFVSYAKYVGLTILPQGLSVCYVHPGRTLALWAVALAAVFVLGATFLAIRYARRVPYVAVGWLWFVITLLPVIGLVQIGDQALADRYAYIPMIGLSLIAAWELPTLARSRLRLALASGACAAVILLAWAAHAQAGYWRDSLTLYRRVVSVNPRSRVGYAGLGTALAAKGRQREAIDCFRRAIAMHPKDVTCRVNLGISLASQGKLDEAVVCFGQALEMNVGDPRANYNLGNIFVMQNKLKEAAERYEQAVASQPSFVEAHVSLANVSALLGRTDDAIAHYTEAVRLNPADPNTRFHLAGALEERKDIAEAIIQYREALRLAPTHWEAANNLAWLLATQTDPRCFDPREAVRVAEACCRQSDAPHAPLLDTLAVAYAADGRYDKAAEAARRALRLAESTKQTQMANDVRAKLRLYLSRCPAKG